MELSIVVLCYTLFTSIAAFKIPNGHAHSNERESLAPFIQNNDNKNDICIEICGSSSDVICQGDTTNRANIRCSCKDKSKIFLKLDKVCTDCECNHGKCVKDNRGITKCNCKRGYAHLDENTCGRCDCGEMGKCMFIPLSHSVDGVTYMKKCLCDQGSAEKNGFCVDCQCGENSKCEFEGDEKICYCIDGYAEKDGVCTKCDCGENGECTFNNSRKICTCDSDYEEINGYCVDKCENYKCENGGTCDVIDAKPVCKCDERYTGKNCETDKCSYVDCKNDGKCIIRDSKAACNCTLKYTGDNCEKARCSIHYPCQNGGRCRDESCYCLPGTSGEFCEKIYECPNLCPRGVDVNCTYDIQSQKAYCECFDHGLTFHPDTQNCIKPCKDSSECLNGGTCIKYGRLGYCSCLDGTRGDHCEDVPGCYNNECGVNAKCEYDIERRIAMCKCLDKDFAYDTVDFKCKKPCYGSLECKNGGTCTNHDSNMFCRCLDGTEGDFCEEIPGCGNIDCGFEAKCAFDANRKTPICLCDNNNLAYDVISKTCKKPCTNSLDCKNGGTCTGDASYKFCGCLDGTEGDFCEEIPVCKNTDCGPETKCVFDVQKKTPICLCDNNSLAYDVISKTCKKPCISSIDCKNGGTCTGDDSYKFCGCLDGTDGDFCEEIPGCKNTDCGPEAKCVFDVLRKSPICLCDNYNLAYDVISKVCKIPCSDDSVCKNGGMCMYRGYNRFCHCKEGTSGHFCENVEICNQICGVAENVLCKYDLQQKIAKCFCSDEDYEFDARTKSCKKCDCGGKEISCKIRDGRKECLCPNGYSAINGKCEKTSCTEKRCLNGKCEVKNGEEICRCPEGFFLNGDECRRRACTRMPCYNGTCVVRYLGVEECVCPAGYTYRGGYCVRGLCQPSTCFGGQCKILNGELTCICPERFNLEGVGCFETVCKIKRCFGGKCDVRGDDEICTCPGGYYLENDVCKKILCEKKNCFGGQCHIRNGVEECECPAGYSIYEDVCLRETDTLKTF